MARFIFLFIVIFPFLVTPAISQTENINSLIQLVDYVGVDYQKAVADGKIISEAEYGEMLEFAATIEISSGKLTESPTSASLRQQARQLSALIDSKSSADQVSAITSLMRAAIIKSYDLAVTPDRAPDLPRGQMLYQENCASCHGQGGEGNGPLAQGLSPSPTNFRDISRYQQRSLYGLFNTITYGVEGTAMGEFPALTNIDRWNLAAFVGQLAVEEEAAQRGKMAWQKKTESISINSFTTLSANEATTQWQAGSDLMAYLRRSPEVLFNSKDISPIMVARNMIEASYQAYQEGQKKQAYKLALTAYLEGFELTEANLSAVDPALMKRSEKAMFQYRSSLQKDVPASEVSENYQVLISLLALTKNRLEETGSLNPMAAFIASLVILLREGLEALLVVVALSAFLMKTDRGDALPYLHFGWISALVLGGVTWLVSERLLQISGATREVTEGVAALVAAVALLFVSFWLHNKTSAAGWQKFIQGNVESALKGGRLWGLAGLAFITVYREVFETILFYQALWTQADGKSANAVIEGFVVASLILAAIAGVAIKYSVRLPLRQFFAATGALLLVLAFIFAGKGIAALQEAGKISQTLTSSPSIGWLGIFPTWEGLALQASVLLIAFLVYFKGWYGSVKAN